MRKWLACCALLGLMVLVASDTNAQGPLGGGGGFGLMLNKGVQQEIKLTDEQKEKLGEKMKEMMPRMFELLTKTKDLSKEERQAKFKEIQAATDKEIATILKPEQAKRLKQIVRQQSIVASLTADEEVIKAVKLSDDQKKKLAEINDEAMKDLQELSKGKGAFSKENQEKIAAVRKEAKEKAMKLLTEEQMKTWKELTGEPYEVKFEGFPFPKKKKDD